MLGLYRATELMWPTLQLTRGYSGSKHLIEFDLRLKVKPKKTPAKGVAKPGAVKGGKKKKTALKYTVDCTHPVEDGIMDCASFVSIDVAFCRLPATK